MSHNVYIDLKKSLNVFHVNLDLWLICTQTKYDMIHKIDKLEAHQIITTIVSLII